jgi:glycosyltransferase involved in cell wall biosynthesis
VVSRELNSAPSRAGSGSGLRICLFAHRPADARPTGIGRYARELVTALARTAGAEVDLVLASTNEPSPPVWVPSRIRHRVTPWPRSAAQLGWCLGAGPHLERALGDRDVTHLLQPFPPVPTASPQVVTVHDLFPVEHPEWYPRSERWTFRRSLALQLRRASRIVVPSSWVAGRVASTFGVPRRRLVIVPHGVSGTYADVSSADVAATCARFELDPERYVICVGAVSERKNTLVLARAAAALGDAAAALVIVGSEGHGAAPIREELARIGSRSRIVVTGYLPDDEAAALVSGAGALAHPALAEGFGLVPLEAMAAGTPVVAARSSSVPEVVGDAAVLVDEPTRPEAWVGALSEVLGSPERRAALADAGRRRAAGFTWERAALTMLEVYREAADA